MHVFWLCLVFYLPPTGWLTSFYNPPYYNKVKVNKTVVSIFIVSTIAGFGISWFYSAFTPVVIIMTAVTLINAVTLTRFRIKYVD